jgi:hypothetical protein
MNIALLLLPPLAAAAAGRPRNNKQLFSTDLQCQGK